MPVLWLALTLLMCLQARVIPVRDDSTYQTLVFLGDSTVVQGDKGSHGFIDILQDELGETPLKVEGVGSLNFDYKNFAKSDKLERCLRVLRPNTLVLMLFDDAISQLAGSIESEEGADVYSAVRPPLQEMMRTLEVTISRIREIDDTIDITVATPLVFHRNEHVLEEVCEVMGGMLKRVAFDYAVGIWDARYPLRKYFEHHHNVDPIRQWDPLRPTAVRGRALPSIVGGEEQESGRLHLNHKGHTIIAHLVVSYFGLEELEKRHSKEELPRTMRDRIGQERLGPHLYGTGLSPKHFDSWHQDSTTGLNKYHTRRIKGREEAMTAYRRRIEEEMKLSNPEMTSRADPDDPRQSRRRGGAMTAADKKRMRKRKKKGPQGDEL